MAITTQYELMRRNKRNSLLVILALVAFVTGLAYLSYRAEIAPLSIVVISFVVTAIWSLVSYYFSSSMILSFSRAREASKKDFYDLYTVTENLCLGGDMPVPKLYVMEDSALNAFATGRDPAHSVVCVTTGLLSKLDRHELEAVIAHELSHIRHYDIRLASLIAVIGGAVVMAIEIIWRTGWRRRNSDDDKNSGAAVVIFYILAILAPLILNLLELALSRQREYLADAGSVTLTRNPAAMIKALEKISGDPRPVAYASAATSELYIADPFKKKNWLQSLSHLFSTHPTIEKRIAAIREISD